MNHVITVDNIIFSGKFCFREEKKIFHLSIDDVTDQNDIIRGIHFVLKYRVILINCNLMPSDIRFIRPMVQSI